MAPRRPTGVPVLPALLVVALVASPEAEAPSATDVQSVHKSPHLEHTNWIMGAKFVQLSAFPDEGEALYGGGLGVFLERTVIEGFLEVELSGAFVRLPAEDAWVVPVDLLFKKPFHAGPLCPYIGIGPTVSVVRSEAHGTEAFFGGAVVAGFYYWVTDGFGFDVELDYAVVNENGVQHELTMAGGPTVRF